MPDQGAFAQLGQDMLDAFKLYVDQHDGKLGNFVVKYVREPELVGETQQSVLKARALAERDGADVAFGVISSETAVAIRDVFDESKIPVIIANANVNAVSCDQASPYVFRTTYSTYQAGYVEGRYVAEQTKGQDVFFLAPDYSAGHEFADAFKEGFVAGGGSLDQIVGEAFPPFVGTSDYSPYLSQVKSSKAQTLYAFLGGQNAVLFLKQFKEFGLQGDITLIGHGSLADPAILDTVGDAADGMTTIDSYYPGIDSPANKDFAEKYRAEYGHEPSKISEGAWVAAQVLDTALGQVPQGEKPSGEALSKALANVGALDVPRGAITMNPDTHNPETAFTVAKVVMKDGKAVNDVVGSAGEAPKACP